MRAASCVYDTLAVFLYNKKGVGTSYTLLLLNEQCQLLDIEHHLSTWVNTAT